MKKVILSIFTIATFVIGTTNFSHAATLKHDAATTLTDVSNINKLEIHGNVTVYISDASTDQVKVYNKYYSESALVQSKNGTLRISSYAAEVKCSVTDVGIGIPGEQQPFLFDRFYRVDDSSATFPGLGLGLYISSEIVKKHQGKIGLLSEPGKGSTFWFTLPLT